MKLIDALESTRHVIHSPLAVPLTSRSGVIGTDFNRCVLYMASCIDSILMCLSKSRFNVVFLSLVSRIVLSLGFNASEQLKSAIS